MPLRLRRRPAVARRVRPSVEVLEGRALPSTTVLLHAGDSIQHAVDAATAGTTILLAPGTYKQTVTITVKAGRVFQIAPGNLREAVSQDQPNVFAEKESPLAGSWRFPAGAVAAVELEVA